MDTPRHTYEYDIDLDSDVAPARVLRMVPKGCRVLEIDPTAIERLRPFARAVHVMDLNDASWADEVRARDGLFDVVIAADVLEHVYDPWAVLGGMKSLLSDAGSVVLSLPHVGHAAVAACLVDEDFEYRPWGLLDRTHIRFFGIKNIQALYASQGLSIEQAEFVVRTPEMTEFVHRWERLPLDVRTALQRNRFAHVFQVVSRAVPKERATNDLRLMELTVPPPAQKDIDHWESLMRSLPVAQGTDITSPFFQGRSVIAPAPRTRRSRSLRRLLGLKR